MQGLAAIAALLAAGYGFGVAGVLGGLTGLVAVLGVGSGLAIATAESGTGVAASGGVRSAQRIGGFLAAGACLTGAVWGGWTVGGLWGLGGYIAGAAAGAMLGLVKRSVRQEPLQRIARRGRDTSRTHGAPGRADGRIARSDHPPGQGQLGQAGEGQRGINRPYKKKPALQARALGRESGRGE